MTSAATVGSSAVVNTKRLRIEMTAAKLLAFVGIGHLGTTGWIVVVVVIVLVAGLAGRLWDRRARQRSGNDQG